MIFGCGILNISLFKLNKQCFSTNHENRKLSDRLLVLPGAPLHPAEGAAHEGAGSRQVQDLLQVELGTDRETGHQRKSHHQGVRRFHRQNDQVCLL